MGAGRDGGRAHRPWPLAMLLAALPSAALPCAISPQAAAEAWARATAACNFVEAWGLLHPADRAATNGISAWTQQRTAEAIEQLSCHDRVEAVDTGPPSSAPLLEGRVIRSSPTLVLEFQHLLRRRAEAGPRLWLDLNEAVERTRGRILADGPGAERTTRAEAITLRHQPETGLWCAYLNLEERRREAAAAEEAKRLAELRRAEESLAEARRREAEAEHAAALRRRSMAALAAVAIVDPRRGQLAPRQYGVMGEMVNGSAETLTRVLLVVELLDRRGMVVGELRHAALPAGAAPLRPGQRLRWSLRADQATPAWTGGVRARVAEADIEPDGALAADAVIR